MLVFRIHKKWQFFSIRLRLKTLLINSGDVKRTQSKLFTLHTHFIHKAPPHLKLALFKTNFLTFDNEKNVYFRLDFFSTNDTSLGPASLYRISYYNRRFGQATPSHGAMFDLRPSTTCPIIMVIEDAPSTPLMIVHHGPGPPTGARPPTGPKTINLLENR